jgi:tetratricopeptide (TPR) repeat protein
LLIAYAAAAQSGVEWNNRGAQAYHEGRFRDAEGLFTKAIAAFEASGTANGAEYGKTLFNMAAVYRAEGDPAKAEAYAKRASENLPEHERAKLQFVLAAIYADEQRFSDAETVLRTVAASAEVTRSMVYSDLACVALARKQNADAEVYARRALESARAAQPGNPVVTAIALNNLAQTDRFQGRYLQAEAEYREAIDLWRESMGPQHPDVGKGLVNLAALYHERQRESGAEELYRNAIAIFERAFGPDNVQTLTARNELADVLRAERRFSESARLGQETLAALEKAVAPDDVRLAHARQNRARLIADTRSIATNRK